MTSRLSLVILVACLVAAPDVAVAQVPGGDVTLNVPLNLTKLSADLTKLRVSCQLYSTALKSDELTRTTTVIFADSGYVPVSNGQLVTTLSIVFSKFTLTTNPAGVTADYTCDLAGADKTGFEAPFSASSPYPAFKLTPTPARLRGTFTW
jgi:hypothetical protein